MDDLTDSKLVARVREGDREAFGHLIERYQYMVERIARKMIADEWIAHELAQEAILQAYLSLDHLRDASRFKSWLYGITLNICRGHLHDQRRDLLSLESNIRGLRNDIVTNLDDIVDPQVVAEEHELHRLVIQAIDDLSSKDKEATLLFYYEQLTLQEMAALLGVSVGTIKGRLHRARKQLQVRLSPEYIPEQRKRQRKRSMRKVTIDAVREHPDTKQSYVVLKDEHDSRLVIWIGRPEALTIAAGLNEISPPRPMTTHLMATLIDVTAIKLKEVRIETCKDDIFYAIITVSNENGEHDLDARPSDALALAVLLKRPMYVAEDLMERMQIAAPHSQVEFLTGFREVDRDVVLNEHASQKENLLQLIASLTRSNLELELERDREEREKTKQQVIDSWKEARKQNQQET